MKTSINTSLLSSAAAFCGSSVAVGNEFMRALSHAASQILKGSGDNPLPSLIASIEAQKGVNRIKALAVRDTAMASPVVALHTGKLTADQKSECDAAGDLYAIDFLSMYENILAQYKATAKTEAAKIKASKLAALVQAQLPSAVVVEDVPTITATVAQEAPSLDEAFLVVMAGFGKLSSAQLEQLDSALESASDHA